MRAARVGFALRDRSAALYHQVTILRVQSTSAAGRPSPSTHRISGRFRV